MAIDAKLAEPVELFPAQRYVAEKQPDSERHVELPGDLVKVPDDADYVSVNVERVYEAAAKAGAVIKCRVELSLDGGATFCPQADGRPDWPWGVYPVGFRIGADKDEKQPDDLKQQSSIELPLPAGSGRVVRVTFIPLQDVSASVAVEARGRRDNSRV